MLKHLARYVLYLVWGCADEFDPKQEAAIVIVEGECSQRLAG